MATNGMKSVNFNLDTREEFCVDGDESRVFRLDIHDINLVSRLSAALPKMKDLENRWQELGEKSGNLDADNITEEEVTAVTDEYGELETDMRHIVDEAVDSDGLSNTILGTTCAFSPVNGRFKYEQIIDVLVGLYEKNIEEEAKKFNRQKVNAKTKKFIQ